MTKAELFEEFEKLLEETCLSDKGRYDALLKYIFDYFSTDELIGLLEHIKNETE